MRYSPKWNQEVRKYRSGGNTGA